MPSRAKPKASATAADGTEVTASPQTQREQQQAMQFAALLEASGSCRSSDGKHEEVAASVAALFSSVESVSQMPASPEGAALTEAAMLATAAAQEGWTGDSEPSMRVNSEEEEEEEDVHEQVEEQVVEEEEAAATEEEPGDEEEEDSQDEEDDAEGETPEKKGSAAASGKKKKKKGGDLGHPARILGMWRIAFYCIMAHNFSTVALYPLDLEVRHAPIASYPLHAHREPPPLLLPTALVSSAHNSHRSPRRRRSSGRSAAPSTACSRTTTSSGCRTSRPPRPRAPSARATWA